MGHLRNGEFGRYTTLKEIPGIDNTNSSSNNNNKESKVPKFERTIKISEHTYRLLLGHSRRFYDVIDYDTLFRNLLSDFESHNPDKSWRDIES